MYEQLRTHIAIPHIANKSATKRHKHTRIQRITNHETTKNIHEHNEFPTTTQLKTYTGEINLPLRLTECTPTIRGMYATHFVKYSM